MKMIDKIRQIWAFVKARRAWQPIIITEQRAIITAYLTDDNIFLADRQYRSIESNQVHNYLMVDLLDKRKWESEIWDCDDFAVQLYARFKYVFRGAAFGICWIIDPPHAVNFFITEKREIWLVEPQNDNIFKKPADWKIWFVLM